MKINDNLKLYITENILPEYTHDESGHGIRHIEYVMERCMKFAEKLCDIDLNILYTAAAYHDIAHRINKENHEILSAQIFENDSIIKSFFKDEEILLIKEAIEDHRASANHAPRSVYGKILSTADRSTDIEEFLRRTHQYTLKHFPHSTQDEILKRAITHAREKYGDNGYAKHYLDDPEYTKFIDEINVLTENEAMFRERYFKINA